ncbi:MAG: hypothetical protein LBU97_03295 [Alistipes sp.]|jgi:N-acetyl-gamma-glutamylphosphate reductase|nr:hypothetical protein [Alistipes sp.]
MKKVGIIGGAGYTGGEAVRILLNHPQVELAFVQSASNAGNLLSDVHADLIGDTSMRFSADAVSADGASAAAGDIDVLMICAGHGDARKWLEANPVAAGVKIIDLSQDFRLSATSTFHPAQISAPAMEGPGSTSSLASASCSAGSTSGAYSSPTGPASDFAPGLHSPSGTYPANPANSASGCGLDSHPAPAMEGPGSTSARASGAYSSPTGPSAGSCSSSDTYPIGSGDSTSAPGTATKGSGNSAPAHSRRFIYGLPEMNRELIRTADSIANPGCFATCLQLGMLPLAAGGLLGGDVHISATTGSTGAGQKPTASTHFSWRAGNLSSYKAFGHQHLLEIGESIVSLQPGWGGEILFIPTRGAFTRGIFATIYTDSDLSEAQAIELYREFYRNAAFTHVSNRAIDLKQVVNTNKCLVKVEKHGGKLLITSAIDNLLKGASGQAVQNMNLMLGLDELSGLRLKATAF